VETSIQDPAKIDHTISTNSDGFFQPIIGYNETDGFDPSLLKKINSGLDIFQLSIQSLHFSTIPFLDTFENYWILHYIDISICVPFFYIPPSFPTIFHRC